MKCKCSCASKLVGLLGVALAIVAVIVKFTATRSLINVFGIQTCVSHLLLGANTMILIALLFRRSGDCGCKSGNDCGCKTDSACEKK